jgi:hypothetical protein
MANLAAPAEAGDPLPPIRFALSPALANRAVLDFNLASASKVYKSASAPVSIEFDCKPENLQLFLDQVRDRAIAHEWNNILLIPKDGNETESRDLIDSYGELSYNDVRAHALTYVDTESREAQDSFMLYLCIMSSLTKTAQRQVRIRGKQHSFQLAETGCGPLLLKVVIMVSHVDTRATINSVRTKMSNLDQTMRSLESDIEKFNEYVIGLVEQLQARGQETQDLLVNLFKGYKSCKDLEFVDYIKKKEDLYEEGGEVSTEQLMEWALNKFKTRQENQTWCQKSDEEETIIALQAQVQSLISKQKSNVGKSATADKKKSKGTKGKNDYRAPWMKIAPAEGEPTSKEVEGKEFHWCPTHMAWVRHKAEECKGLGFRKNGTNSTTTMTGPAMRLSNALSAVHDDEDEDDDDEE